MADALELDIAAGNVFDRELIPGRTPKIILWGAKLISALKDARSEG